MKNKLNLADQHYRDLKKSGLSDETIREARFESVPLKHLKKIMGHNSKGVASAYKIPFGNGFIRYKIFYEPGKELDENGKPRKKYHTKKDSGNKLYIPPRARLILNDASIPLDVTEGEKKSLKGCQSGLNCIAITGLWNWKINNEEKLIDDFDQINLKGRNIIITPDSHWLRPNTNGEPKYLKQAVLRLAYLLIDNGAKVSWRELPVGEREIKLDDYLCVHSLEDLKQLPLHKIRKLTLTEMIDAATPDIESYEKQEILKRIAGNTSETDQSQYINKLHEKTKISKRAIQKDINNITKKNLNRS
ncbi:MAG: hypothetical protein SCARUB_01193 [Candidatus Scalindua rubra]|uniref:DUF3854 domain-containing protein n=1 Tax=Candidatus Scalindua rubra TaxID=1872076 RepID=A0A1E3XDI5_9BACT|nr:MAG: hypothetical protein SCARUB_01193 [Candidatus Scalindua rubra]